jgi:dihydrofolate synthase/folylpolyglutamate synthase
MASVPVSKHTYDEAIAHLSHLIPEMFSGGTGKSRRKFSLDEIGALCRGLGDPQKNFPSILIAGTNGKGSTASTLAAIACEAGLRVGLYTSPHLDRVNERIKFGSQVGAAGVDGRVEDISDADFGRLYFDVIRVAERLVAEEKLPALPSFFELLTGLAFVYFAEKQVDLAVLEVGMGGRLDATNIVDPLVSVITDISLDHQEWLGETIDLIAREKAGILRRDGVLVTLPQHPEANQAIGEVATALEVRGVNAAEYMPQSFPGVPTPGALGSGAVGASALGSYSMEVLGRWITVDSPLKGVHQHRNLALAMATAVELAGRFPSITAEAVERGIRATRWPGRLERIRQAHEPEVVLDVAHNPAGAWALRSALSSSGLSGGREDSQVLIFACLRDKPLQEMTQILFPIFDHVVLAPIHSPRAREMAELLEAAAATGVAATAAATVAEAIEFAHGLDPGRIVISGSLYLVGEARGLVLNGALGGHGVAGARPNGRDGAGRSGAGRGEKP